MAAAAYENDVEVWDIESQQRISRFHTILDDSRLDLAYDQQSCVAGNYRDGVALYNIGSSLEVWRRPDLRGVQFLRFSKDGQSVFCGFERGPGQVLSAEHGRTTRLWRGVRQLFESPYDERVLLYRGTQGCALADSQNTHDIKLPRLKPSPLLDVAFSPSDVCLSEYPAVRCFSLSGVEIWRTNLSPDEHMTGLSYQHRLGAYFGVILDVASSETSLVKISREEGTYKVISSLGRLQQAGFCGHSKVVCTDGNVWSLETGNLLAQLWVEETVSQGEPQENSIDFNAVMHLKTRKLVERLWGTTSHPHGLVRSSDDLGEKNL